MSSLGVAYGKPLARLSTHPCDGKASGINTIEPRSYYDFLGYFIIIIITIFFLGEVQLHWKCMFSISRVL